VPFARTRELYIIIYSGCTGKTKFPVLTVMQGSGCPLETGTFVPALLFTLNKPFFKKNNNI